MLPSSKPILLWSFVIFLVTSAKAEEFNSIEIPDGFHVSVYASDPLVRNPCAMAFDARNRLFIGQGPQYRKPSPESQTDRVTLLIDSNNDGVADQAKTFAEGFNNIQGLAWYGDQLWVANAPDLTVVRDIDGDDQADEYQRIYGGLGNLEHALHGLVFAPDGRLYMSKGNSKGYLQASSPERFVAPAVFADLWGVDPPMDAPIKPEAEVYTRETYQHGYHTPSDDWGTEGGVLRCRPDGSELEVYARGMRNMWDMNFDANFNWVGTDQDQDGGDRILNPFLGAHFGWGHAWSPHWTGENHLPSTPISGPVFHGSGTGVVSCASQNFPKRYRDRFFCADWLSRTIFVYQPQWDGASMRNMGSPEVFAKAPRGRTMGSSQGLLFDPTDIEFGPDGALWVLSWGHSYGATIKDGKQVDEGRVYRISFGKQPKLQLASKYSKKILDWTLAELIEDLQHNTLPVHRTNAQVELLRRGNTAANALAAIFQRPNSSSTDLPAGGSTWAIWTLAQMPPNIATADSVLQRLASSSATNPDHRRQALSALGYRASLTEQPCPEIVRQALTDDQPRIRFAAVQAIHESRCANLVHDLWELVSTETDRAISYAARTTLGKLQTPDQFRSRLTTGKDRQRLAALLMLLEQAELTGDDVIPFCLDSDPEIAAIATSFVAKVGTTEAPVLSLEPADTIIAPGDSIRIVNGKIPSGLHVRYSIDGTEPTDTTGTKYTKPFQLKQTAVISASLFKGRERMGPVLRQKYTVTNDKDLIHGGSLSDVVYPVNVYDIKIAGGRPYTPVALTLNARAFSNRGYRWKTLPENLAGHTFIQPRNDDQDVGSTGAEFLSFRITESADIFIAHDQRIRKKPDWLTSFSATGLTIETADANYDLFVKTFPAGRVILGGNTLDGRPNRRSQYVAIVKPAKLQPQLTATTVETALQKLPTADVRRGERLFFNQADCAKCHRIGDRGNAFAPQLSDIGTRATAKAVAESILQPSAVITEGFHSIAVLTEDGQVHNGFIKQESGLNVQLVQTDGSVITIAKDSIERRKRQSVSAMPSGMDKQLSPQQVADLIRFITEARKDTPTPANTISQVVAAPMTNDQRPTQRESNAAPLSLDPATPITIRDNGSDLLIQCGDKEVATYIYRHNKVQRPFFAHVKAPSGTQLTRNFPPSAGDSKDHADMHPGLWMAFGDISGEDFWRNKGRVVHEKFVERPTGGQGRGSFLQRKSYQRSDGSVVCVEDFRCTIHVLKEGYLIDWHSTFSMPPNSDKQSTEAPTSESQDQAFYFGDQEEMGLGIRVATPITEKNSGQITDSKGRKGAKRVWSQSSAWCDYSGFINNEPLGITLLCHPENFRESWMHARNYGLVAANAFGRKAMKKGGSSKVIIRQGETLQLRYGILLHGPKPDLNKMHREYVRQTEP